MNEEFKKNMNELKEHKKITRFEYEQLLCLNYLTVGLVNIEKRLIEVGDVLRKIEYRLETIASKE